MNFKTQVFCWLCLLIKQTLTDQCTTPDNRQGRCVSLLSCPEVLDAFVNVKKGKEEYLLQFICAKEKNVKVCCNTSSNYKKPGDTNVILENIEAKPPEVDLQEAFQCDRQKYPRQDNTSIQLAEIRAINSGSNKEFTKCVGQLINTRYVLTAAECLEKKSGKNNYTNVAVRFKINVNNKTPFKYYGIEEEIPHPFYDIVDGLHNVALIRLSRTVLPGENVQPICLRSPSLAIIPISGDQAISSGKVETSSASEWKATSTKLLSNEQCNQLLEAHNIKGSLNLYMLCTTDIEKTTDLKCSDIAGTPVFFPFIGPWLGGISSSKTVCGSGAPNVYTDVNAYLDWILENMRPWAVNNEKCVTLHGEAGEYLSSRYCPKVMEAFANPEKSSEDGMRNYIYEKEDFVVCCNLSTNKDSVFGTDQNITIPKEFINAEEYCGYQHSDDYFSEGHNIKINEFPWVAYIAIRIPGEYEPDQPQCIGSLINNRYVITTAFCIETFTNINIVRLGEFNTKNSTDCVIDPEVGRECSTYEEYGIEEKLIHPFYSGHVNNVALLRLNRSVDFSDFIRPICLPLPEKKSVKPGDLLFASGFGYDINGVFQDLKKKVSTTLLSDNRCRQELVKQYTTVDVNPLIVCAKEFANNTEFVCGYDDGGPLIFVGPRRQWRMIGILNSVIRCGGKEPLRYTRVSKYLKWIFSNIRP